MEIFLQLWDELDDLVLSIVSSWETIRRFLLRTFAILVGGGLVVATASFFPITVLSVSAVVLLSTALIAIDGRYELRLERTPN